MTGNHHYEQAAMDLNMNLADGVTALAHLYALYSDRAHSFNQ